MSRKRYSKEKKHRTGEIPTGSFSDIAFLLIIYFIIATTLVKVKSVTADLPSGEKAAQSQPDKTPIINLRGTEIFFNDKKVSLETLNERLAALNLGEREGAKKVIMFEATNGTPYAVYFPAMAAISANQGVVALVDEDK